MNREDVIENMVEQYRGQLEEQEDEELLGGTLDTLREDAKVLFANTLEDVREGTIEEMVEQYQRQLDGKPDEELIGGHDDSEQ
jgi:hypothetical protein